MGLVREGFWLGRFLSGPGGRDGEYVKLRVCREHVETLAGQPGQRGQRDGPEDVQTMFTDGWAPDGMMDA